MVFSKKISQSIYVLKFFAVLSIISAHCNSVASDHSAADIFASRFIGSFGCVGVGIFLLIAGFLMHGTTRNFKDFFISKIKSIIIPWAFCGTLVYLYVHLRKGGLGIFSLLKWLAGVDTYLYYLSVLFVLYFACYFVRRKKIVLFIFAFISVLSNIATSLGFLDFLNHYLNPLNFLFFFVMGILMAEYNAFEKLLAFSKKALPVAIPLYIVILLVLDCFEIKVGYFILPYIPIEALAIVCAFGLSDVMASNPPKIVTEIGGLSYSIYLLHMPVAGVIAAVFGMVDSWGVITLLRPITVLAITYFAIKLVTMLANKFKPMKFLNTLIGAR